MTPPTPPPWKVVGASVRGSGHHADGTPGQDAHSVATSGEWLVAAVCDGAGSTALGGVGARVGAEAVVEALVTACKAASAAPPGEARAYWHRAALDAVKWARRAVERALREAEGGTDDRGVPVFERAHATLVAVAARPSGGVFVHIGDGTAAALAGGAVRAVSRPANGQYANETFFFTQSDWDGHLRLTAFEPPFDLVVLMSDGGAALATEPGGGLHAGFFDPVSRYLDGVDAETGREALRETLAHERTHLVTDDDKTVVWARLVSEAP